MSDDQKGKISLLGALAIGIGGMVGGGIFAVLGVAVSMAQGATPIAFALAGGVAMLTAYLYAKLSVAFPSQGGTVVFLDRAFGYDSLVGAGRAAAFQRDQGPKNPDAARRCRLFRVAGPAVVAVRVRSAAGLHFVFRRACLRIFL